MARLGYFGSPFSEFRKVWILGSGILDIILADPFIDIWLILLLKTWWSLIRNLKLFSKRTSLLFLFFLQKYGGPNFPGLN